MVQVQKMIMLNKVDENAVPTGGSVRGIGIAIDWQTGPLGKDAARKEQNGAFVEDVLVACLDRLKYYQNSKFNCPEYVLSISGLEEAIKWLGKRTEDREKRLVEGTNES